MWQKTGQNQIKCKNRFIIGVFICLLTFLFIGRTLTKAQTTETKNNNPELVVETGHASNVRTVAFSPNGKILASGSFDKTIKLWNLETGQQLKSLVGHTDSVWSVAFSPDGKTLASGFRGSGIRGGIIKLWNTETGQQIRTLKGHEDFVLSVAFSPDGKTLASGSWDGTVKLWDIKTGKEIKSLVGHDFYVDSVVFSPDGKTLASGSRDNTIKLWNVETGQQIRTLEGHTDSITGIGFSPDGRFLVSGSFDATMKLWDREKNKPLTTLISLDKDDWIITTSEGRFDTNKSLDRIEGLHWIVNDEILKPLPLDVFMRQYYEPGLLPHVMKCNVEKNCEKEFKPLPSIAEINRVQPKVAIKEIKSVANLPDLADVTIEVENVTEDVSLSATDRTKKKQLSSGGYDLRLFRDGQLVGVSTPKDKLEKFIKDAPRLVAETRRSGKLLNTPEDIAWREANDLFKLKAENVKFISPTKIEYTFRRVKLPRDGRQEVEFSAYAFNSDKVRSNSNEPVKFTIPTAVANAPKKGRVFLVSIGVNASENPAYNLRYAANDARKMQEIVGSRLKAESAKYSEVIQIPLISDYDKAKMVTENSAQKAVIKGVFSLLAGNKKEVPQEILKQIPNRDQIKAVEPEDTLIITYSGHGYADQAGIFYLLPYDIGQETTKLTTEALSKLISSDELSLWMQDITAAEMMMVIDACHSSAAVQGDGFKPGPMGSRGLGQLAYDKDMKILSATQADNVALELGSLQQGLLSYSLLQDGIISSLADTDKNQQLLSTEWLLYAERRVPELYREVKDGKREIMIDGKINNGGKKGTEVINLDGNQKSNLNLQQPSLFYFKRRKIEQILLTLPQ